MQRQDSFEMNEAHANGITKKPVSQDDMVIPTHQPKHLREKQSQNMPPEFSDEIPTRDKPAKAKNTATRPNGGKSSRDLNFASRKQITIDENDDTVQNASQLSNILARGERLR